MTSVPQHDEEDVGRERRAPQEGSVPVTLLYAPADRPALVEKALRSEADAVVVDLEDAVAPQHKGDARQVVHRLLGEGAADSRAVQVRINPLDGPWGPADLAMVDALPGGVDLRLPKTESGEEVRIVRERLGEPRRLHCLIESCLGVENAFTIGTSDGVASLALGEADLRSELGPAPDALAWSRSRVVVAARAAGLAAPMQSVWTAIGDLDGLAASCLIGRREGFVGRAAIHPVQLPVIRRSYRPDPQDVSHAQDVLRRVEEARLTGRGTAVTPDGDFLDEAMVHGARSLLALERACRDRG